MTDWHVGMRVVCVDANSGIGIWLPREAPQNDAVYTVRGVFVHPLDGILCLRLYEVRRDPLSIRVHGHDGYGAFRFRPLRETTIDISIFRKLVEPSELAKFKERVGA